MVIASRILCSNCHVELTQADFQSKACTGCGVPTPKPRAEERAAWIEEGKQVRAYIRKIKEMSK